MRLEKDRQTSKFVTGKDWARWVKLEKEVRPASVGVLCGRSVEIGEQNRLGHVDKAADEVGGELQGEW